MSDLDLSLPGFKVPGVPGYTPPFGTKKPDGESLTTEEVIKNMELLSVGDVQTINIDKEATSATYNIPNLVSDAVFFKPSFHNSGLGSLILKIGKAREGVRILIDVHSLGDVSLRIDLASPNTDTVYNLNGLVSWLVTYVRGTFTIQPVSAIDNNERLKIYAEKLADRLATAGCYQGKNLADFFDIRDFNSLLSAVHQSIRMGFENLRIGDYYDIPSITLEGTTITRNELGKRLRMVVSGYNLFKSTTLDVNVNHVLWTFQNVVFQKLMRQDGLNTGYTDSYLHNFLTTAFYQALRESSNNSPWFFPVKRALYNNTDFADKACLVFLPSEQEVFGYSIYGNDNLNTENPGIQFPIYRNSRRYRVKTYRDSPSSWWMGTINPNKLGNFCAVDVHGNPDYFPSATVTVGVSPAFCTQ